MKKHIPNGISLLRALGAVLLCMFQPFSAPYWIVYLLCGISESSPAYAKAQKLLDFLKEVICLKPAEIAAIPPTSIMREFIGGQTL